jgi:hypothetical protein
LKLIIESKYIYWGTIPHNLVYIAIVKKPDWHPSPSISGIVISALVCPIPIVSTGLPIVYQYLALIRALYCCGLRLVCENDLPTADPHGFVRL